MKQLLNAIMERRARRLGRRLGPYLPQSGQALDIGSGTGHTAQALRCRSNLHFVEMDVADLSVVGPGPLLFSGERLPWADDAFACSLMLFVLRYPADPLPLLREAGRVTAGPILVLQSTYQSWLGRAALQMNEILWGPVAFGLARMVRFIGRREFTLKARRSFTRFELFALFQQAGLRPLVWRAQPWPALPVSYDLFVLERYDVETIPENDLGGYSGPE